MVLSTKRYFLIIGVLLIVSIVLALLVSYLFNYYINLPSNGLIKNNENLFTNETIFLTFRSNNITLFNNILQKYINYFNNNLKTYYVIKFSTGFSISNSTREASVTLHYWSEGLDVFSFMEGYSWTAKGLNLEANKSKHPARVLIQLYNTAWYSIYYLPEEAFNPDKVYVPEIVRHNMYRFRMFVRNRSFVYAIIDSSNERMLIVISGWYISPGLIVSGWYLNKGWFDYTGPAIFIVYIDKHSILIFDYMVDSKIGLYDSKYVSRYTYTWADMNERRGTWFFCVSPLSPDFSNELLDEGSCPGNKSQKLGELIGFYFVTDSAVEFSRFFDEIHELVKGGRHSLFANRSLEIMSVLNETHTFDMTRVGVTRLVVGNKTYYIPYTWLQVSAFRKPEYLEMKIPGNISYRLYHDFHGLLNDFINPILRYLESKGVIVDLGKFVEYKYIVWDGEPLISGGSLEYRGPDPFTYGVVEVKWFDNIS